MSSNPSKYNNIQVVLHWLTAVLVLFMLVMGHFSLENIANSDPEKIMALRGHMVIGSAIFLLTLFRIVWRRKSAQPPAAGTGNARLDKIALAAHYGLNILTLLVTLSGIGLAVQAGLGDIVFAGNGSLPESLFIYPPRVAHGILTKLLAALIILHLAGALYHQFILKDGPFGRMRLKNSDD